MKKLIALAIIALALTGCSTTNMIRITELDAEGQWIPFVSAKLGGCVVEPTDVEITSLTITYKDEKCAVTVKKDKSATK